MAPDPRPPKRIVDPRAGIEKVAREGRCRVCGTTRNLNRAHIVAKGQRGDDVDANIAPACGSGTTGCHGILTSHNPGKCGDGVWRTFEQVAAIFRARMLYSELDYVLTKESQEWLDRVYPTFAYKEAA